LVLQAQNLSEKSGKILHFDKKNGFALAERTDCE
jgi:hypothetical protein